MRRFFLLLAVFAVIGGCATEVVDVSDQPMSDERRALAGHRFESVSIVVDGQAVELGQFRGEGARLEIGFGLSHIYASGGCNDLTSGAWEVVDGRLVTGPDWSTTLRRCGNDVPVQDRWLADFLSSSPDLTRAGDALVLSAESTVINLRDMAGLNRPDRIF